MFPSGFGQGVSISRMFLDEQPFQLQALLECPKMWTKSAQ